MQPITYIPDAHAAALADLLVLEPLEILEPEEELVTFVEIPHEHVQDPGRFQLPKDFIGSLLPHVLLVCPHAAGSSRVGRMPLPDTLLGDRIG